MAEQVSSLKTGIKYKNTPIGKIPVDWEVISLKDVSEINMGQSPPSEDCNEKKEGLPFYQGNAEFGSKYPSPKKWCEKSKKIADEGDILISVRAPVGEINIAPHKCCIGRGLAAITAKSIHSQFLYHLLFLRRKYLQKISQGSTFEAINSKELSDLLIFLPAVTEQKKIAEILTTLDEAIEKTSQIIEKTKEAKKGLMQKLLTRGIGHKKFKKTEIGEIPVEWEVGEISDYGEILTGNTPPTNVPQYYGNEYPFVSPFDLGNKRIIRKTEKYLSKEGFVVARALPANSVLVVCIGSTIGKTGIAGTELATNQQINSIICKNSDYNFVYYYATFINQEFKQLAGTQAVPILNKGNFSKVKVAIPPLSEQKEIGGKLSAINEEIEKESDHKEQMELLKKGLMQVLLTGKIRVSV
jgi:type I restriction enzyme S subunit